MKATEAKLEHTATDAQLVARKALARMYAKSGLAIDDQLFNLGLYVRSGVLVKFLLLADLYQRAMKVPGVMLEAGVWLGQNLVLLENLRAIFEPFHKQRKVLGFDTFTGYTESKYAGTKMYDSGLKYVPRLANLLHTHAAMNVYGHQPCPHEIIVGDVSQTAPAYFAAHPQITVALAILDMGPYKPTKALLEAIKPRLLPGSLVLLDEFTLADTPGEARAWLEVMGTTGYRMERLERYPSKVVAEIL